MSETTESEHFDINTAERKGYFKKKEDGMPRNQDYRKSCESCGNGFHGARWDAHHVLPQTSLTKSVLELKSEKQKYIFNVQYVTDWVINDPGNMIGLPRFTSYLFYYQYQDSQVDKEDPKLKESAENNAKVKRYINTFNNMLKETRKEWLKDLAKQSPENHPIHIPVSWGHTIYNKEAEMDIKERIWDPLNEVQKKHEVDAEKVKKDLNELSSEYRDKLVTRGKGANRQAWNKRYDQTDNTWYKPFTMEDIPQNPLFKT